MGEKMVDFPCHVALVYRLAQVLPSGKDEQFAIENGQLYLIYLFNMVIFHSFLCVYQKVSRRNLGIWLLRLMGFITEPAKHWI